MAPRVRPDAAREIPLEERLRQKKLGFATYPSHQEEVGGDDEGGRGSASAAGDEEEDGDDDDGHFGGHANKRRRANKNCPLEITSKRAVGRFRNVVEVKSKKVHDPRFESMSGKLNEDLFAKSYSFLDEYKQNELQEMKKQLKHAKSATRKEELKRDINLRSQELAEKKKSSKIKEAMSKRKHEERDAVASGKNPFYLKRKDKKKVELHAKFKDLQESGRLSKFMEKKRKKNASKDHRWLPTARKS